MALLFLLALSVGDEQKARIPNSKAKILAFMAGITYPLYLTHYTVIEFFLKLTPGNKPIFYIAVCALVSNAIAVGIYLLVDRLPSFIKGKIKKEVKT